eukprot:3413597-Prymnesium_polylepis.1
MHGWHEGQTAQGAHETAKVESSRGHPSYCFSATSRPSSHTCAAWNGRVRSARLSPEPRVLGASSRARHTDAPNPAEADAAGSPVMPLPPRIARALAGP